MQNEKNMASFLSCPNLLPSSCVDKRKQRSHSQKCTKPPEIIKTANFGVRAHVLLFSHHQHLTKQTRHARAQQQLFILPGIKNEFVDRVAV